MLRPGKQRRRRFLFVLFLCLIDLSFLVPFSEEMCNKNEYTYAKECTGRHPITVTLLQLVRFFDSASASATAFATVLLAVITWKLVVAGRDQTRTTQRQLRAYIGIIGGSVKRTTSPGFLIELKAINQGQTPAHDVEAFIWAEVRDFGDEVPGEMGDFLPQKWAMAPQALWTLTHPPTHKWLKGGDVEFVVWDESAVRDVEQDRRELIIWGRFTYRDVFPGTPVRETRFCYRKGKPTGSGHWNPEPCVEGNTST